MQFKLHPALVCAAVCLMPAIARAQTGYVTVTESHLMDAGVVVGSGTVSFYPVDNNGQPVSYRLGSSTGGQIGPDPFTAVVTSGVYSISLPDSELTFPVHACYKRVVTDSGSGDTVSGPGFLCVQVSNQAASAEVTGGWCAAAGACNLDLYPPDEAGVAIVQTGPPGPPGPPGLTPQAAIASASAIAPTAQFFHVTGTTAINTITPFSGCAGAGLVCQITIVPDGLWTTGTSGNIALASAAVVSKALIMTYDPATSKWYPSY